MTDDATSHLRDDLAQALRENPSRAADVLSAVADSKTEPTAEESAALARLLHWSVERKTSAATDWSEHDKAVVMEQGATFLMLDAIYRKLTSP